jgi:hypothetical protein
VPARFVCPGALDSLCPPWVPAAYDAKRTTLIDKGTVLMQAGW